MIKGEAEQVAGTRFRFRWPCGFARVVDLARSREFAMLPKGEITAASVETLREWWARNGLILPECVCKVCRVGFGRQLPVRYEPERHHYFHPRTEVRYPSVTQLVKASGKIFTGNFRPEHAARGTAVAELTAAIDLEAIELEGLDSEYRPELLAYRAAVERAGFEWDFVETAFAVALPRRHAGRELRFAGRPDRVGRDSDGRVIVMELKRGRRASWHALQTALQAMLIAPVYKVPERSIRRLALYVNGAGEYDLREHPNRADFDEARGLVVQWHDQATKTATA